MVTRATPEGHEILGFPSHANPGLFCRLLTPDRPAGGVLICPTLSVARLWSEDRERELLREVVRRGCAGMVFDYRGEGRSAAPSRPGLTALRHDANAALDVLARRVQESALTVVGIGVGGIIAAETLTGQKVPVASWGSPSDVKEFFLDLIRERVIQLMGFSRQGDTSLLDRVAVDVFEEEMGRGSVDALGFPIPTVLVSELSAIEGTSTAVDGFAEEESPSSVADWACRGGE